MEKAKRLESVAAQVRPDEGKIRDGKAESAGF
jgi:hypothetical protein